MKNYHDILSYLMKLEPFDGRNNVKEVLNKAFILSKDHKEDLEKTKTNKNKIQESIESPPSLAGKFKNIKNVFGFYYKRDQNEKLDEEKIKTLEQTIQKKNDQIHTLQQQVNDLEKKKEHDKNRIERVLLVLKNELKEDER